MFDLSKQELAIFKRLSTPIKIQDFLDTLPMNYEKKGETYMSPRRVLREKKAHCFEGALLAAAILWYHGEKPLFLDLKVIAPDVDHTVVLYKKNGYWGAISKTNHATVRFRDPIYRTVRELALSYFHEYFLDDTGVKTLRSYSPPFDLRPFGKKWITTEDDLHYLVQALDDSRHYQILPKKNKRFIRKADKMERRAGKLLEWTRADHRT